VIFEVANEPHQQAPLGGLLTTACNYKSEPGNKRLGPMAVDFYAAKKKKRN